MVRQQSPACPAPIKAPRALPATGVSISAGPLGLVTSRPTEDSSARTSVDGGVTLTGGVQLIRKKTVATGTICLRAALLLDLFMDVPSRNGSQEQGVVCP